MSLVATEEMDELPEEVKQCSVVYIPEVGYLLSVVFWKENLTDAELEALGPSLEFKVQERGFQLEVGLHVNWGICLLLFISAVL